MASASPVSIQAILDRAPVERSESKSADAGGGRFAGLMVQFSQPQAMPNPPAAAPVAAARSHRAGTRKTPTRTGTPPSAPEVGHPAAAAWAPAGPAASPIHTNHSKPKQPSSEAIASGPRASAPKASAEATLAANAAPSPATPGADPGAPIPEALSQGATTVPPAQPISTAAPGLTPDAAALVLSELRLPGLPSTASQSPATQPNVAAPAASAQPTDPALAQAVLAGLGARSKGTGGSEDLAPGPVSKATTLPVGEPITDKLSLPAELPQALAQLLGKTTSLPVAAGLEGATPQAPPTAAPQPVLDAAPPSPAALTDLDAAAAPKTSAQPAGPALVQAAQGGPGASSRVARGSEDLTPGPVTKAAAAPVGEPITDKLSLPAELPQALAQLKGKGTSLPVAAGPVGATPQTSATGTQALATPDAVPAPKTTAPPAGSAFVQAVLAGSGADLKVLHGSEDLTHGPLAKAAAAPVAEPTLGKSMSQPIVAGPKGMTLQPAPTSAPQPVLDATAPPIQALGTTDGDQALKTSVQPAAPALLQAALAEQDASLKGFRGSAEPAPGPMTKDATTPVAEPITAKPSMPAALPQDLAQALAKATSQPGAGPEATTSQAPLKGSGTTVPLDPGEPKLAPDLQSLAGRTLDGASPALLGTLQRATEGPAPTAPAAAPAPPQAPATPPSAPVLQVEGGLRWMLKSGSQEAQLQLHPDALGQVTIHLKVEGGEVHAKVWVTEAASVQAVKEGRPHLEQSLRDQGLHLGSFDLQQGHRPFQEAPSAPIPRERALPEATVARQEAPAPAPAPILNAHHVELYA